MNQNIYQYSDGVQDRFGDPMRINRLLFAYMDGNPKAVIAKSKSPIPEEAIPATETILNAGRKAFDLVPYDDLTGEGAQESVIIPLINNFWAWCASKKKNGAGLPTAPAPTVLPDSSPTLPMNSSLPSG